MRTRDESKERALRRKAVQMIVREGLDGLSMQRLARAARVSPATIYIYFKDREDLINQVYARESERMFEATLEGFDPSMSFREGLWVQWQNRARFFMDHPVEAQFMEQMRYSHLAKQNIFRDRENFSSIMKTFLHGAIERKEVIPLPLEVYWSVAFAPLYQLIKFHNQSSHFSKGFKLSQPILSQAFRLVYKALTPEPQPK